MRTKGTWRTTVRELQPGFRMIVTQGGRLEIYSMFRIEQKLMHKGKVLDWHRTEQNGPTLSQMLLELNISDKEASILKLLEGTAQLIETLIRQYESQRWLNERNESERRAKARAKKKESKRLNLRLTNKQPTRVVEI